MATKADRVDHYDEELAAFGELTGRDYPSVTVSAETGAGLDTVGTFLFEHLGMVRVYTKIPGQPPDRSRPFTVRRGQTVDDVATLIHKDLSATLRWARLWRGEIPIEEAHPFAPRGAVAQVAEGCAFVPSFANVSAFATGDGLVLVDTGSQFFARSVHEQIRGWSPDRLNTAVYSHGHIDHVFGVPVFEAEARERGWPAPHVIAHEALPHRFDRYIRTAERLHGNFAISVNLSAVAETRASSPSSDNTNSRFWSANRSNWPWP